MERTIENINEINQIVFDDNSIEVVYLDKTLYIKSNINGNVIDNNFNELDKRLSEVESQLKLRVFGEINRLKGIIDKHE